MAVTLLGKKLGMTRVFGEGGYAVLRHPERLPQVLVGVLRAFG